jgi:hypothetical protein
VGASLLRKEIELAEQPMAGFKGFISSLLELRSTPLILSYFSRKRPDPLAAAEDRLRQRETASVLEDRE